MYLNIYFTSWEVVKTSLVVNCHIVSLYTSNERPEYDDVRYFPLGQFGLRSFMVLQVVAVDG